MLNHKKSYVWVYILVALVLAGAIWAVSQEMPFEEELVEEPLANTLGK